jgi:hypothetical protein
MPETGALLAILIVERPLCVECISDKSGLAVAEIEPFLVRIERVISVRRGTDCCRACGRSTMVYSVFRSD